MEPLNTIFQAGDVLRVCMSQSLAGLFLSLSSVEACCESVTPAESMTVWFSVLVNPLALAASKCHCRLALARLPLHDPSRPLELG